MKKVKNTVLRKTIIEDLAKEYGVDNLTKCPVLEATDEECKIDYIPIK